MNYATHYNRLIERARNRVLPGYKERHHVLPRCMGGTDAPDNLVDLTAEEHYVAHQLLVKMYPNKPQLVHAVNWMTKRCSGNKVYGWIRRLHAKTMSNLQSGRKISDATRAKLSAALRGRKRSLDAVARTTAAIRGKPKSPQHRKNLSAAARGRKMSQEAVAKQAAAIRGRPLSLEHRQKISAGNTGKTMSEEARRKIAAYRKGRTLGPQSIEHRSKISAALKARKRELEMVPQIAPTILVE